MNKIDEKLYSLSKSKFRSSFHLAKYLKAYVEGKGMDTIERHAYEIIKKNIAPAYIKNDGRQTPMKNHPVFIAEHACACCCRNCLEKWHHIPKGRALNGAEINYIVELLMEWIKREMN